MVEKEQQLVLRAHEESWRLYITRREDEAFQTFRDKVFLRDQYTCYYCAYQACYGQDVINLNGNYRDNRLANMATACPFCVQCGFMHAVEKADLAGGILIYMPEMTQKELSALTHSLFDQMASNAYQATEAKTIYRDLKLRSQVVEKYMGAGLYRPEILGQVLIGKTAEENKQFMSTDLWKSLRLLPLLTSYRTYVKKNVLEGIQRLQDWSQVLEEPGSSTQ